MFHRVCPAPKRQRLGFNKDLEVTPQLLEETIQFLKSRKYELISLDELSEILQKRDRRRKVAVFTLDDGYVDNYTHAYPIFKKYRVPFTIYVTTSFPDRNARLWWYLLEDLIFEREYIDIEVGGHLMTLSCRTAAERERAFGTISDHLVYVDSARFSENLAAIFLEQSNKFDRYVDTLALTWPQIQEMSCDPLVTIAAHTVNHLALSKINVSEAMLEILKSKEKIESNIGKKVEHFAYPFGGREAVGMREFRMIRDCGFKTATTTRSGNIFPAHADYLECLPRIAVTNYDLVKNINYLNLWVDGLVPCHENSLRRVITT